MDKKNLGQEFTLIAARHGIDLELNEAGFDIDELIPIFRRRGITLEDLIVSARLLEGKLSPKRTDANLTITDGAAFVLGYLIARDKHRENASVNGGQFIEWFANAMVKTVCLANSEDRKQSRASTSLVTIFTDAVRFTKSKDLKNNHFSSFIEIVEELSTPRRGQKVRVQNSRGRPKGAGSYKESDRQLLLKFRMDHGRLPKYAAEYEALTETAGGIDSADAYDRSSTISRLRRAATALRREGF